jgi:hypothetical protein
MYWGFCSHRLIGEKQHVIDKAKNFTEVFNFRQIIGLELGVYGLMWV